jgi:hypothetical protein
MKEDIELWKGYEGINTHERRWGVHGEAFAHAGGA